MEDCEFIPSFVSPKYKPRKIFAVRDFPEGLKQCTRHINLISKRDDAYDSDNESEEPIELDTASDYDVESEIVEPVITCDQQLYDHGKDFDHPETTKDQKIDQSLKRARIQDLDIVKEDATHDQLEDLPGMPKKQKVVAVQEFPDESNELYAVRYGIVGKYGTLTLKPRYFIRMNESLFGAEDGADESEDEDELCETDVDCSESSSTEEVDALS